MTERPVQFNRYYFLVCIVFVTLFLSACAATGLPEQDAFAEGWRGKPAPSFDIERLNGSEFGLKSVEKHKIVIVNFFGTWCPPCRKELPALNDFYHNHRDEVQLIGISLNEKAEAVREFMEKLDLDFPVGLDPGKGQGSVSTLYGVPTLPTTVVINPSGRVHYYKPGMLSRFDFEYFRSMVGQNTAR